MQTIDSPLAVLRSVRPSIAGRKILDIGCGTGSFAGQLVAEGAETIGIDPGVEAIQAATAAVPQATFFEGVAEALPFDNATFDIGMMINALHHVPEMAMQAALGEAARVVRPNGVVIIVEPLPTGNFFSALRLIEDETVVRLAAQRAIETSTLSGVLRRAATFNYIRREVFQTVDGFLDRIVAVDPSRREIVEKDEAAIRAAVLAAAEHNYEGSLVFDQPIKADVLERA
jgi:ubiquinone/menaquinone biosynthesis C-methylase UbiE